MICSGKTLVFTAVTLAIVGASQLALAQAAPDNQPVAPPAAAAEPGKAPPAAPAAEPQAKPEAEAPTEAQAPEPAVAQGAPPAAAPPPIAAPEPEPEQALAPPAAPAQAAPPPAEVAPEAHSWFARTPLTITVGQDDTRLVLKLSGEILTSVIHDSTRSYDDKIGSALVARSDTIESREGRTQFSPRGSALTLAVDAPELGGVHTAGVLSLGMLSSETSPNETTESRFYDKPALSLSKAYLSVMTDYVDVLAGLTRNLFGWEDYYRPSSVEYLGLPNQTSSTTTQVRLSHRFGADGPVSADVGIAAVRPAQRDSEIPDATAGLRLAINDWRGLNGWRGSSAGGDLKAVAMPLSVGVSGVFRQFKVDAFTPPPSQNSNSVRGGGVAVNAFVPVIPAQDDFDRGNRLTLTGSFVMGTGIGDLVNSNSGAEFPTLPNPALAQPPPVYEGNVDDGLVTFDTLGILHTIDWRTINAGLIYYLPPNGRLFLSGNFTHSYSENIADLYPQGGSEVGLLTFVARQTTYVDGNLFFDATPALRIGGSVQYTIVEYIDGDKPDNIREMVSASYVF